MKLPIIANSVALAIVTTFSTPTYAFTDGSGWQIVAQLTTLLETANENLKNAKEVLDVEKQLEEFETVKAAKEVSSLGKDLQGLFKEMDTTVELFSYDEGMELGDVQSEFKDLIEQYKGVKGEEDTLKMLKGYAGILESIENLSVLREFHAKQMQAITSDGMNEGDAAKQAALTGSIQTQLLIEQSIQKEADRAIRTKNAIGEANYIRNMGGIYGAMAGDDVKKGAQ